MKQYLPLILFLLRFLGSYLLLIILYNWYLNLFLPFGIADPYTKLNAESAAKIFNAIGIEAKSLHVANENYMRLYLNEKYTAIVNEGCNALSVCIIFVAFILAFYTNFKQTLLYILGGLLTLIVMNFFRITLLTSIYYYYPAYGKSAHDYLFPAIIYGTVIILWIVWIKFFVIKYKNDAK